MVYQSQSAGLVAYKVQSGLGTQASALSANLLRIAGGNGIRVSKAATESAEVRNDGLSMRGRHGSQKDADEQSPDRLRAENVDAIVARTKTFSPVRLNGEELSFSRDKARELLLDPRKGWLLVQVMAFLRDEQNFMPPSATS